MKLIFSSCDFGDPQSAQTIRDNLPKPLSECRVLYFPNETATRSRIKSGRYEARVEAYGFSRDNITVANYFDPAPFFDLDIDAVYVSGGNTFGTMKMLRRSGLDRAIVSYVERGAVYIGGSAGAHVATASIAHVSRYDHNSANVTDLSGLGLYGGILICHFSEERRAHLEELTAAGEYTVVPLSDSDCLVVTDD